MAIYQHFPTKELKHRHDQQEEKEARNYVKEESATRAKRAEAARRRCALKRQEKLEQ